MNEDKESKPENKICTFIDKHPILFCFIVAISIFMLWGYFTGQFFQPTNSQNKITSPNDSFSYQNDVDCPDFVLQHFGTSNIYKETCNCVSSDTNKSIFYDLGCNETNTNCNFSIEQKSELFRISKDWYCSCNVTSDEVKCDRVSSGSLPIFSPYRTNRETKKIDMILKY